MKIFIDDKMIYLSLFAVVTELKKDNPVVFLLY